MRYTSMTTFNKEPIARPTTFAESFNMKYLTLSLIAIILVTSLKHQPIHNESQSNTDNKIAIIAPLEAPVYAEAQEVQPVATKPTPAPTPTPVAAPATGSCADWLAQAGISDPDAIWLISHESGCRPTAQNPSSTAYGIFQFLDGTWANVGCVKTSDPVEQMRCGQNYVMKRYGSWAAVRAFWEVRHWY